jgi:hypothetical protein
MRFITRTKAAVAVTGLVLALAVQGLSPGHAQTGGTISQFGTDQTLTASATGVTTTQAFPDGATSAGCFIQVTSASGAQSTTMGSCTGITLTITCASSAFSSTQTSDQHGAAIAVGGTRTLSGAYDTGGPCAGAAPEVGVIAPTSAATLTGFAAASNIVWFINNDTSASRNGCFQYFDNGTGTTKQCFTNASSGNNGTFYEVTSSAKDPDDTDVDGDDFGRLYQTKAASGTGSSGNLTIGGVFIEAAGGAAATATPGGPTATPGAPTATPVGGGPPPPPTFIPTPITPPPAPPTDTPTPVPPTATALPATDTPVPAVPTNTPKPSPAPTNTTVAAAATSPPPAAVKPVKPSKAVTVPTVPPTGAGGTYVYSSNGAARLSKAALASAAPGSLPQTGGADGGNPTSPLAPLALLGALGVLAGRTIRKMRK